MSDTNNAPAFTHLVRTAGCVLAALLVVCVSCSDNGRSLTTHTSSMDFKTKEEKMEFLARYLVNQAGLLDAEYRIDYQDNGRGAVPGPSDYDLCMALRVVPDSVDAWTADVQKQGYVITPEPWRALALDSKQWVMHSVPELYVSSGQMKQIYRAEGIVLAWYTTRPLDPEKYKLKL